MPVCRAPESELSARARWHASSTLVNIIVYSIYIYITEAFVFVFVPSMPTAREERRVQSSALSLGQCHCGTHAEVARQHFTDCPSHAASHKPCCQKSTLHHRSNTLRSLYTVFSTNF